MTSLELERAWIIPIAIITPPAVVATVVESGLAEPSQFDEAPTGVVEDNPVIV